MKREEQIEQKKQLILNTALELFVRKSYVGTKTSEISKKAGISEGLLFHYYPTKESLLKELVEIGVMGQRATLSLKVEQPLDYFYQFTEQLLVYLKEQPFMANMFALMSQVLRNEGIPEYIRQMADTTQGIQYSIFLIKTGQENETIKEGDPEAMAYLYWCTIQGIAEQYASNPQMKLPEVEWIVSMLKA
jgi:AcrR family transcriptional regulator